VHGQLVQDVNAELLSYSAVFAPQKEEV